MINLDPRVYQKLAGVWNETKSDLSVQADGDLIFRSGEEVIWCVALDEFLRMEEGQVIKSLKENGLEFRSR